jgi:hypothetical protein
MSMASFIDKAVTPTGCGSRGRVNQKAVRVLSGFVFGGHCMWGLNSTSWYTRRVSSFRSQRRQMGSVWPVIRSAQAGQIHGVAGCSSVGSMGPGAKFSSALVTICENAAPLGQRALPRSSNQRELPHRAQNVGHHRVR